MGNVVGLSSEAWNDFNSLKSPGERKIVSIPLFLNQTFKEGSKIAVEAWGGGFFPPSFMCNLRTPILQAYLTFDP